MSDPVLADIGGSWDQLMASSGHHTTIVMSTSQRFLHSERAPMSSLLSLVPSFDSYYTAKQSKLDYSPALCPQGVIGLIIEPPLLPGAVVESLISSCTPIAATPSPTIPQGIPTIIVTDVDASMPKGANYNSYDDAYRAMSNSRGLLWSGWRGKFSPSQCGSEIESGDKAYFEGQEDKEEIVDRAEGQLRTPGAIQQRTNSKISIPAPEPVKELEWWEIEGDDDETGDIDEDSDSDCEDDDDDDTDSDEYSDSEDGDDEHEDDSEDDDSGEDSDFDEESEDTDVILNCHSVLGASIPLPQIKLNPDTTHVHPQGADHEIHIIEEDSDTGFSHSSSASSSCPSTTDSDFESYKSCTTISSLSSTPILPSSPCVLPLDGPKLLSDKLGGVDSMTELWRLPESSLRLIAYLNIDLCDSRRAETDLEQGQENVEKSPNIEGLDLA